ncbi:hypothetical protein SAMN05216573_10788 [Bradyrhizobium sp. Rc3b]|nr:hypothetical protein SAMN05216573_10788 [Bradyrhizobium sp. Rc3b]
MQPLLRLWARPPRHTGLTFFEGASNRGLGLQEPDVSPALVQLEPALLNCMLDAGAESVADQEKQFPTKYRKFGDSLLVSLDEQLFEDGTATRGDSVSRGLWED